MPPEKNERYAKERMEGKVSGGISVEKRKYGISLHTSILAQYRAASCTANCTSSCTASCTAGCRAKLYSQAAQRCLHMSSIPELICITRSGKSKSSLAETRLLEGPSPALRRNSRGFDRLPHGLLACFFLRRRFRRIFCCLRRVAH